MIRLPTMRVSPVTLALMLVSSWMLSGALAAQPATDDASSSTHLQPDQISVTVVPEVDLSGLFVDEWRLVQLEVTAYDDSGGMEPWGVTASGTETRHGVVAAPPEVPFGTELYIPGYGPAVVEDRGCAIQGRRLDVWMPTRDEANAWGRQTLLVWIKADHWPDPAPSKCPGSGW